MGAGGAATVFTLAAAGRDVTVVEEVEQGRLLGVVHEASHPLALAGEGLHQVLAQPAGRARDDGHAGRSRVGGHRNCLAEAVARRRR